MSFSPRDQYVQILLRVFEMCWRSLCVGLALQSFIQVLGKTNNTKNFETVNKRHNLSKAVSLHMYSHHLYFQKDVSQSIWEIISPAWTISNGQIWIIMDFWGFNYFCTGLCLNKMYLQRVNCLLSATLLQTMWDELLNSEDYKGIKWPHFQSYPGSGARLREGLDTADWDWEPVFREITPWVFLMR